jgi:hypothetical protein
MILTGNGDGGLATCSVLAVLGNGVSEAWHAVLPVFLITKRYVPFWPQRNGPHCRPPAGNLSAGFGWV